MDDQTRSIIRNVKGPGTNNPRPKSDHDTQNMARNRLTNTDMYDLTVRENDILCLLESEREARRLR